MKNKQLLSGLSLFSGAGGMDIGFSRAGVQIVSANDIDRDACLTYEANHPRGIIKCDDINQNLTSICQFKGVDIVFGGPPCQGFSVAGKMNPDDPRSKLLWTFMEVVEMTKPRAFVCENVKALAVLDKWTEIRQRLFQISHQLGYQCKLIILNSSDFGVPQSRERMFLIGFRGIEDVGNLEVRFAQHRKPSPTVKDIISPLGVAGSKNNQRTCNAKVTLAAKPVMRRSPYAGMLFNGQGRPLNPGGYSCALHASMGGNKTPIIDEEHCYFGQDSWVEWYHSYLMKGEKPLSLNAAPKRLRRLTIDEALRIQSFPHDYQFIGRQSSVYKQIGNAVPCDLAQVVAEVVRDFLTNPELVISRTLRELNPKQLPLTI